MSSASLKHTHTHTPWQKSHRRLPSSSPRPRHMFIQKSLSEYPPRDQQVGNVISDPLLEL